ncbi:MAG: Bro-N domain-containing protein [Candidatus Paceibacterota bacterium]
MEENNKLIVLFDNEPVRRAWSQKDEKWYFSVVDIVKVLAQNDRPRKYWDDLKRKLKLEGSELSDKIGQLKLLSSDGKKYLTDVADVEAVLRIIQSIPSPKAEPFKLWLAKVGYERMQETVDPELAMARARKNWQMRGQSDKWIQQRMLSIEVRNKLTDYWADNGVEKVDEYAKLTNIIHSEWSGLTVKNHKDLKGLKQQNLRDHMTDAELIFTALAELSTRQIAQKDQAQGYGENKTAAHKGGKISGNARKQLEKQTGKKVVTKENFLNNREETKKIANNSK